MCAPVVSPERIELTPPQNLVFEIRSGCDPLRVTNFVFSPEYPTDFLNLYLAAAVPDSVEFGQPDENGAMSFQMEPNSVVRYHGQLNPVAQRASARITFETNSPELPAADIPIEILERQPPPSGAQDRPNLEFLPYSPQFGTVNAGEVRTALVLFYNDGLQPVLFDGLEVDAETFTLQVDGGPFDLDDPDGDGRPGLAPEGFVEVEITHMGTGEREFGEFDFQTNSPFDHRGRLRVSANLNDSCVRVSHSHIDFGSRAMGAVYAETVRLESCGTEPLEIENVLPDGDRRIVTEMPALPLVLPAYVPGEPPPFIEFPVTFEPVVARPYQGMARIFTSAGEARLRIFGAGQD